jgi:hypothetical protein
MRHPPPVSFCRPPAIKLELPDEAMLASDAAEKRSKWGILLKRSKYATGVLVAVVLGLLLYPAPATAARHAKLPPTYEHWLDEESIT